MDLRTPKGTHDYSPRECFLVNNLVRSITDVFELHGAVSIDTPTFELRDLLCSKYGEDAKLIFDLADQGGDVCSLRYDLTVSFARYLAKNKIQKIKRFQIGKVFRRDQPSVAKGRLREFIQCDFDIAGSYMNMTADAEVLCIVGECFEKLNLRYRIRVSSRQVLGAYVQCSGVDMDKFMTVCSSIDKMDKMPWSEVAQELRAKGLDDTQLAKLEKYVGICGGIEVLTSLKENELYATEDGKKGVDDLVLLVEYLQIYGVKNVVFDLSLARGLDYYTGMIFEAVLVDFDEVGSVAGGGRYDMLVSSVLGRGENAANNVPCVGFSFGITRMLPVLQKSNTDTQVSKTVAFVGASGALLLEERMGVLRSLWASGIAAETFYTKKYTFSVHLQHVHDFNIPFFIVVGAREIVEGKVKLLYGKDKTLQMQGCIEEVIAMIRASE